MPAESLAWVINLASFAHLLPKSENGTTVNNPQNLIEEAFSGTFQLRTQVLSVFSKTCEEGSVPVESYNILLLTRCALVAAVFVSGSPVYYYSNSDCIVMSLRGQSCLENL